MEMRRNAAHRNAERAKVTRGNPVPWLTGELVLYGLILCLALTVRLGGIQIRIMDAPEADQAWQAWRLTQGDTLLGRYSPLLLSVQSLLFTLFGASDAAARVLPALAGGALVVLPYLLRRQIGRVGAILSALALALSPTLTFVARYGSGISLLLALGLGAAALWMLYRERQRPGYLHAISILAALALLSDPRVISLLVVGVMAGAVERALFGRNLVSLADQGDQNEGEGAAPVPWRRLGLTFVGTLALAGTTFGFNLGGLGAWADFPSSWARRLAPVVNGQPWYYPLQVLTLYEPLLFLFGVLGGIDLLVRWGSTLERQGRASPGNLSVLFWLALGLLAVAMLAGGRDAGDLALVCVPLALLAGHTFERLISSWQKAESLTREGIFVLVLLGILVYVGFEASFYARSLYINLPQATQFFWFWLLAVTLLIVLVGMYAAWFGIGYAWRAVGAVLAVALLLNAFSLTTSLNFGHPNDPRELHISVASTEGTRDALRVMEDLAYHRRSSPVALPLTVEASLGPVWPWYLRNWEKVTFVEELTSQVNTPMVLSSEDLSVTGQAQQWNPADQYVGQDFVAQKWWQPSLLTPNDRLTWWLYRKSIEKPVSAQTVVLWIQVEEQLASGQ